MSQRVDTRAWERLLSELPAGPQPKRDRLVDLLIDLIDSGRIAPGSRLPGTRTLADLMSLGRNTALRSLTTLAERGYITLHERSGAFVSERPGQYADASYPTRAEGGLDWAARFGFAPLPAEQPLPDPESVVSFKFGGFDIGLFPIAQWRECERAALGILEVADWAQDRLERDDNELVAQIRKHILPMHGIWARSDELLVTLGGQESRYLVAQLIGRVGITIGLENPGVPDISRIFATTPATTVSLQVGPAGAMLDPAVRYDALVLTPGHQYPTTAVMPLEQRRGILERAERENFVIVEDTFETEILSAEGALPPLTSLDNSGRTIYIGTLSRLMAPGLRAGFIVAPPEVIRQLRAIQRLILRHPPGNNQRLLSIFIERGYYTAFLRTASREMERRSFLLAELLTAEMPELVLHRQKGTSWIWCNLPPAIDSDDLEREAAAGGVLLDSGRRFFRGDASGSHIRLSVGATDERHIREGVSRLTKVLRQSKGGRTGN